MQLYQDICTYFFKNVHIYSIYTITDRDKWSMVYSTYLYKKKRESNLSVPPAETCTRILWIGFQDLIEEGLHIFDITSISLQLLFLHFSPVTSLLSSSSYYHYSSYSKKKRTAILHVSVFYLLVCLHTNVLFYSLVVFCYMCLAYPPLIIIFLNVLFSF